MAASFRQNQYPLFLLAEPYPLPNIDSQIKSRPAVYNSFPAFYALPDLSSYFQRNSTDEVIWRVFVALLQPAREGARMRGMVWWDVAQQKNWFALILTKSLKNTLYTYHALISLSM